MALIQIKEIKGDASDVNLFLSNPPIIAGYLCEIKDVRAITINHYIVTMQYNEAPPVKNKFSIKNFFKWLN